MKTTNIMFKIYWRSLITGATGHGKIEFYKERAEEIVTRLNSEYKTVIVHWYQKGE